jgi:hypothetical protein
VIESAGTSFAKTEVNRVRRLPARGSYDRKEVYEILDSKILCHVGLVDVIEGQVTNDVLITQRKLPW